MKMLDMLRAMNAYTAHDSGGVEELAQAVNEPRCAITGCDEWPVTTCVCCNREVCSYDIVGVASNDPGICSDCVFVCAGGMACKVVSQQDAITCPTCGAVVEPDALKKQTMADGELMWPRPFCRACLVAGLRRLDAELKRQPGKDGE